MTVSLLVRLLAMTYHKMDAKLDILEFLQIQQLHIVQHKLDLYITVLGVIKMGKDNYFRECMNKYGISFSFIFFPLKLLSLSLKKVCRLNDNLSRIQMTKKELSFYFSLYFSVKRCKSFSPTHNLIKTYI